MSKFLLVSNSPPPPLRLEHPITFSIHVARPTSSFVTGAAAALAIFSCAFTRKAYELTTHFRVQPNGKGQGLIGDIPLQLSGVGNTLLQFTILEIYHEDTSFLS
jgi:hypothetical protein